MLLIEFHLYKQAFKNFTHRQQYSTALRDPKEIFRFRFDVLVLNENERKAISPSFPVFLFNLPSICIVI